jgi:hypothetical protein
VLNRSKVKAGSPAAGLILAFATELVKRPLFGDFLFCDVPLDLRCLAVTIRP